MMMRESELGRATTRANMVEEALCKLKKTSIEIAKKGIACDIKRNQNEMKERLHRYRKRQKDIFKSRLMSEREGEIVDDFQFASEMLIRKNARPKTCPPGSTRHTNQSKQEPEIELDPLFYGDQQKSKIDLRPRTAISVKGDRDALKKLAPKGKLGSQISQTRYFDEDELEQRFEIYKHILKARKVDELGRFDSSITVKVGEFCSNNSITDAEVKRRLDRNTVLRSKSEVMYKLVNKQPKFSQRIDANVSRTISSGFGKLGNRNLLNTRDSIVRANTAPASSLRRTLGERASGIVDRSKGQATKSATTKKQFLRSK